MRKTDTVPSLRLATRARVPERLIDTPAAPRPACSVANTVGADAFRSITVNLSSGRVDFGFDGSIFVDAVTNAIDWSGAIATLCGGPTIDVGARSSPRTFGGEAPKSRIVTVSGGGLGTGVLTPSTSITLLSLADIAIWAAITAKRSIFIALKC